MQRMTLGDFELTALSDGIYYLDGGAFFGIVPKVLWSKRVPFDADNRAKPLRRVGVGLRVRAGNLEKEAQTS